MQVIYYGEEMPYKFSKSLFLAGPSLRSNQEGESWRKDALQILKDIGFENGVVFVPENRNGKLDENHNYVDTVSWEQKHIALSDCLLFWVPRSEKLPGRTTNIEWGNNYENGRCVLGFPEKASHMEYFKFCAKQLNIPISYSLTETIENALSKIGDGAERVNGERCIPIDIWRTHSFQNWYKALTQSGNRIDTAKILHTFRPNNKEIFAWTLQPSIYVAKENRVKENEFIIARPDISSVCMYARENDDIEVILVKEFRSAASNEEGMIYELPSGHTPGEKTTPEETAINEVREETGFDLDEKRLKFVSSRQLAGTLSTHKSHLFSYELTDGELEWFRSQKGVLKGLVKEGERCYIEVLKLSEIQKNGVVDWSHLGMIMEATKQ